jgi:hypothetical protein
MTHPVLLWSPDMHRPDCNSPKDVGEISLREIRINTFQTGHCKIQNGFHCLWCSAAARRSAPIGASVLAVRNGPPVRLGRPSDTLSARLKMIPFDLKLLRADA